ncbi:MAG: glycosyltransferase [Planctomycetota bacterium]
MNILFVSYGDFYCNSSIHVFGFANQLVRMGHACAVAVPKNKESVVNLGDPMFNAVTFTDVNAGVELFKNGDAPDVIHCWTPREIVRKFVEPLRRKWTTCKLAIHLEDNEERLAETFLNLSTAQLNSLDPQELDKRIPDDISHPRLYREFLASADGVSVIMDRLKEFLPYNKPVEILWPGIDFERFNPDKTQSREKEFAGIQPGDCVVSYTGHVHWANREDVRTLYLAVGELNKRGVPTKLLRTGEDFYPFLSPNEEGVRRFEIKLGRIEWSAIPRVLNAADVLIQPGHDDEFNAFRLPSKLPEFLAMGKPVILPHTNLGRFLAEGDNAILLKTASVLELATSIEHLFKGPELRAHLGSKGREFAETYFNWTASGKWMERFHERLCGLRNDEQDRNPILTLTENPTPESPSNQAAFDQLMQLNCARWPAIVEALIVSEARLAKMSADGMAAKAEFETRLFETRKSRSWRFMRFLRRCTAMLRRGEDGGFGGFLTWLFKRPGATKKNYDPFEGTAIHFANFDRSEPEALAKRDAALSKD